MKRGMTILEVLIALALLGGLSVAAAGWIELSARLSASAGPRLNWERSANASLQAIADDLAVGDRPDDGPTANSEPRVLVDGASLRIRTRFGGASVIHLYKLHQGALVLHHESGAEEVLLGDVVSWTCELDTERRVLTVGLTRRSTGEQTEQSAVAPAGLSQTRSYRVP